MKNKLILTAIAATALAIAPTVKADLQPVGIWNGKVGMSIDAVGSNNSPAGMIQAQIPVGASIKAAYLYSAGTPYPWYANSPKTLTDYNSSGITLAGNAVTFDALVGASAIPNRPDIGNWFTARADVTSIVTSLAAGGGNFSWAVNEGTKNSFIDGEVLAIVYEHSSLATGSVVFLDGGLNTAGETSSVNFANPLGNVSDPNFVADMSLAISFSTGGSQSSQVDINGTRLTSSAGGYDDGILSDGGLITAGGIGDSNANPGSAFSTGSSSYDDELYSLKPFLSAGDTSFSIYSKNPSNDDNLFFMGLRISAEISQVNDTPAPGVPDSGSTVALLGLAAGGMAFLRRRFARA
ncbi:VPDSG-CTERM sorting domain-containing protein [Oleiharenicola lentus]|nr:VPDSG-CTERM sorting domain-containing protein [Oleiharenicola lentus]